MQKINEKTIRDAKQLQGPSEQNTAQQIRLGSKRRGEFGEAAFLRKAASMGFGVSKPWGDSDRYDLVVDVGGRMLRVQVKSAHRLCGGGGKGYNIRARCRAASYREDEIDFLVAYIVPEDIWYIFPPSAFKGMTSIQLYPYSGKRTSRFEQYREAWGAFHAEK